MSAEEVRRGCGQSSALPTRTYPSDPYPVPLRFFLICGPSMPPATRPQMHCLSLPPAPAPSSCLTMPGGFQEHVRGWHRRVDEVLQCTNCSFIAPGSDGRASTPGALTNSLLPHPPQRQGVRGEAPLCSIQLCGHRHRHEPLGGVSRRQGAAVGQQSPIQPSPRLDALSGPPGVCASCSGRKLMHSEKAITHRPCVWLEWGRAVS